MVEFYNARLTEREKRRDFLRARGLLNMKRMQVRRPCCQCSESRPCLQCGIFHHGRCSRIGGQQIAGLPCDVVHFCVC